MMKAKDKTIQLSEVATGKLAATLIGHTDWVQCLAVSSDGKMLHSASPREFMTWDVETRRSRVFVRAVVPQQFLIERFRANSSAFSYGSK